MSTVAIIHAAEDALPARALAEKLRQAKLTVVLERQAGDDVRTAVKDAKVTVALWSPRAIGQQPLVDDVAFARGKSKLVHAVMQNAQIPEAFRSDPGVNLTGWRGEDDFAPWRDLAKLVTDRAGVAALPPPPPRPPSGFFQPGVVNPEAEAAAAARGPSRVHPSAGSPVTPRSMEAAAAPRPQAQPQPRQAAAPAPAPRPAPSPRPAAAAPPPPPRPAPQPRQAPPPREPAYASDASAKKGGAGLMIGIVAAVVVLGLAGGGYYFYSQSQGATATATAWESIDQNDVNALRNFIDGDPGEYREEAQTALATLEASRYAQARSEDSIPAYESFLNDFPSSENAIAARGRIAELQIEQPTAGDPALTAPATTPDPDLVPPNAVTPDAGPPSIASPPAPEPEPSAEPEPLPTN